MSTTIENLLKLLDSGKEENIEMAMQLYANLDFPHEYQWLKKYLIAKKRLPKQYPSWYLVYCAAIKIDHYRIQIQIPRELTQRPSPEPTYDVFEFTIQELYENVANELHFMMRDVNAHQLIDATRKASYALRFEEEKNTMFYPKEDKPNLAIVLANKLLNLIRTKRDH